MGNEVMIPVESLFKKFKQHLDLENNHRILFSGKFGIGKTYYLNEYFKTFEEEYDVYHLFPVNYQISSNEDIIEFLKYDILLELQTKSEEKNEKLFNECDYSSFIDIQRLLHIWGSENKGKIFDTLLPYISNIPKVGKPLKDTIGLISKFLDFSKSSDFIKQIQSYFD